MHFRFFAVICRSFTSKKLPRNLRVASFRTNSTYIHEKGKAQAVCFNFPRWNAGPLNAPVEEMHFLQLTIRKNARNAVC